MTTKEEMLAARAIRAMLGADVKQMARRLGLSKNTITRLEHGRCRAATRTRFRDWARAKGFVQYVDGCAVLVLDGTVLSRFALQQLDHEGLERAARARIAKLSPHDPQRLALVLALTEGPTMLETELLQQL